MPTFGESPPAWTMPVTWMRGDNLGDKFIEGQKFGIDRALAMQRLELEKQAQASDAISQGLRNQLMQEQLANITGAKVEVADWMKATGGDITKILNTPYTGANSLAAQQINSAQSMAANSLVAQAAQQDIKNFNAQVGSLMDPKARSRILSMPRTKDGLISPEAFSALEIATAEQEALKRERQIVTQAQIKQDIAAGKQVRFRKNAITGEIEDVWAETPSLTSTKSALTPYQQWQKDRAEKKDASEFSDGQKLIMSTKAKEIEKLNESISALESEGKTVDEMTSSWKGLREPQLTADAKKLKALIDKRDALQNELMQMRPAGIGSKGSGVRRYNPVTDSFE